jgi:hypothetical protein
MVNKLMILIGLLMIPVSMVVKAQESLSAAGGEATGGGGSASYSVGQLFYSTYPGQNGSVAEGVQQPYEISVITSIEEIPGIISAVFPNPVTDFLILRTELDGTNISFRLFDAGGRLLDDKRITDRETMINMGRYSPGIYFLIITDGNRDLKTFKIIKQ